jgi:hypothetical protein
MGIATFENEMIMEAKELLDPKTVILTEEELRNYFEENESEDEMICDICGNGWEQHDDGECPRNISEYDVRMEMEAARILGVKKTTVHLTQQQNDLIWEPKE